MPETLLSPSGIKLYGSEVVELHLLTMSAAWAGADAVRKATRLPKAGKARDAADAAQKAADALSDVDEKIAGQSVAEAAQNRARDNLDAIEDPAAKDYETNSVYATAKAKSKSYTYIPGNPSNYDPPPYPSGANTFLRNQLEASDARLARIYGFSYEGHYYDLPKPALFLVHGSGEAVIIDRRSSMDEAGVAAREWEFSGPRRSGGPELRRWDYDKGDFSIRLDIETGPFEQILLATCLRGAPPLTSGSDLRMSGSDLRMSGSDLRISGSDLRSRR